MLQTIFIIFHAIAFIWSMWNIFNLWDYTGKLSKFHILIWGLLPEVFLAMLFLIELPYAIYSFWKEKNPQKIKPKMNRVMSATSKTHDKDVFIMFDGTWKRYHDRDGETNISKLYDILNNGNRNIYYICGIGCKWYEKHFFGFLGIGVVQQVITAYRILQLHIAKYPNANLYVFGFSRGAFAARSFTGLIQYMGVLKPAVSAGRAFLAYRYKLSGSSLNKTYPALKFLGLFDTVSALGIDGLGKEWNKKAFGFHDFRLPDFALNVLHCVSLDEKRASFKPVPYDDDPRLDSVSFQGDHSDVGGGHMNNNSRADISLYYMLNELNTVMGNDHVGYPTALEKMDEIAFNHADEYYKKAFYGLYHLVSKPYKRIMKPYTRYWNYYKK